MSVSANKHLLIVEDELDFAGLIEAVLRSDGYSTTVSLNGEDALEQARYWPPDLVTLDIEMPRKSGLFFYRKFVNSLTLPTVHAVRLKGERLNRG